MLVVAETVVAMESLALNGDGKAEQQGDAMEEEEKTSNAAGEPILVPFLLSLREGYYTAHRTCGIRT